MFRIVNLGAIPEAIAVLINGFAIAFRI